MTRAAFLAPTGLSPPTVPASTAIAFPVGGMLNSPVWVPRKVHPGHYLVALGEHVVHLDCEVGSREGADQRP